MLITRENHRRVERAVQVRDGVSGEVHHGKLFRVSAAVRVGRGALTLYGDNVGIGKMAGDAGHLGRRIPEQGELRVRGGWIADDEE